VLEARALVSHTLPAERGPMASLAISQRWFRSTLRMKPDEIVEVALPSGEKAGAFGNRVFSIRIRTKQIR
jgi:hypothetical protein